MDIQRSLDIPVSPDDVWSALADFAAISTWAPNVDHSAPASEARSGVGAVRRVQVGRIALLETVTDWQPGRRLGYTITGLPPVAGTIETSWQLEPHGDGTHTTVTTAIHPPPKPAGRIVARVLSRRLSTAAGQMLSGLSHHLQERAS